MLKGELSWYRGSEIEQVLEKTLDKHGLTLAFPKMNCNKDGILIDREIELRQGQTQKRIVVNREFYRDTYNEDIWFDLGEKLSAGICNVCEGYTAYWYIANNNRELLNLLKDQEDLDIYVAEELENLKKYGIDGNIGKVAEILVNYCLTKIQ